MTYDFHIHSCLSPCADDDMTPANIAGFAKLNKVDAIAVADHNSALNLPATAIACKAYGVKLLPAIEVTSEEEIHVLAYLPTVEAALQMGKSLYQSLPSFNYKREIWGSQLVMDENDNVLDQPQKLLTSATRLNIYQIKNLCHSLGGIAVPAHIDKDSTSLLSVLGFAPDDLPFDAYEVAKPEHNLQKLLNLCRITKNQQIITSSDAHSLSALPEHPRILPNNSCLWRILGK